jgi:hypothetical protein
MQFQKFQEYVNESVVSYTDKYVDLTLTVLQTQAQNKLLHWGTLSFAQHKAFDDFKEAFDALSDDLIESIMGKYGRPITGGSSIEVLDYNQIDLDAYFNSLYDYFTGSIDQFQPKENNEEIVNVLAEIIALIDKTKYLLTLNESELLEALNEDDNRDLIVVTNLVDLFLKKIAKDFDYPMVKASNFVKSAIKKLGY